MTTTEETDAKSTVLIIEDHADVFIYLSTLLKDKYSIVHAENGVIGIQLAKEIIPDIIISDIMMPKLDGFSVCEQIKNSTSTNHIPVILLTAKANMEDKLKGLQLGADAYLYKPFHQRELLIQIEQLIQKRKNLQAVFATQIASPQPSSAHLENDFLKQINEIIQENIQKKDISHILFKELAMSRSQVYRKIKALTDLSTTNYIKKVRIKKAYNLLSESSESISEIAYLVGFKDPAHFSRAFKTEYGISPRSFRATLPS